MELATCHEGHIDLLISNVVMPDLAYHCQDVDMKRGAVQDLKSCAYEEVVPPVSAAVHFRAFPVKYTLRRNQTSDQNVITAE